MKMFKSFMFAAVLMAVMLPASIAFAQVAPGQAINPVTGPVAIVTVLSVILGFVTQAVQSGSILGIVVLPKPWLPEVTLFGSFLGGAVAYLGGLGSFALSGSVVYYAVMAGLTALLAGAAPGLARHAHSVVPAMMAQKAGGK